jgi:hypothetical protein
LNQPAISHFHVNFLEVMLLLLIVSFVTIDSSNMLTNIIYLLYSLTLSMENLLNAYGVDGDAPLHDYMTINRRSAPQSHDRDFVFLALPMVFNLLEASVTPWRDKGGGIEVDWLIVMLVSLSF